MLRAHVDNAERLGLRRYLKMDTFTHYNTDGPDNPFARVYSTREVERDFPDFQLEPAYQRYMHAPPLPVHRMARRTPPRVAPLGASPGRAHHGPAIPGSTCGPSARTTTELHRGDEMNERDVRHETPAPPRAGVILDRDGTIIEDPGYVGSVDRVELLDGAAEAIAALNAAGIPVAVATNQAGVARGLLRHRGRAGRAHAPRPSCSRGRARTSTPWLFCPYHPDGVVEEYARWSSDRKPAPGMALAAAQRLGLDLTRSWVVGDSDGDVGAGPRRGRPRRPDRPRPRVDPTVVAVPDLATAVGPHPGRACVRTTGLRPRASFPQLPLRVGVPLRRALRRRARAALGPRSTWRRSTGRPRCSPMPTTATRRSSSAATAAPRRSRTTCSATTSRASASAPTCSTRVTSLATNVELLSAIANDIGYDAVFEYQLESLARPGDVLVAVSSSGSVAEHRAGPGLGREQRHADHRHDRFRRRRGAHHGRRLHPRGRRTTTGSWRTRTRPACTCSPSTPDSRGWRPMQSRRRSSDGMRVAVNLLTDDPHNPSGAHWFWTRVIPEMASRMTSDEELRLLVSPKSRPHAQRLPGSGEPPDVPVVERAHAPAHAQRADLRAGAAARSTASTSSAR